jgi:hypothetical protein
MAITLAANIEAVVMGLPYRGVSAAPFSHGQRWAADALVRCGMIALPVRAISATPGHNMTNRPGIDRYQAR